MKTFFQYVSENSDFSSEKAQQVFGRGEEGNSDISDDMLIKIIRRANKKFPRQTERFFNKLAELDVEIRHILDGVEVVDRGVDHLDPRVGEVVPSSADGGHDENDDSEDEG